ncbi:hypothetical protein [Mesorhizobium sp. B2-3-4]|uniref:hypothetical protein n=1 Tax=Mesorhizobium sp. B2-3-4 TaxID=2589959 RepID=UPI00112C9855|nr:hypothetical protein [Mesorhizobium sp. B2-3-4]TPM39572.1 hypothetical protein FJ967_08800 [Mesorhizobium sp. B2-3-4]
MNTIIGTYVDNGTSIIRASDGVFVPVDAANADYLALMAAMEGGATIAPYTAQPSPPRLVPKRVIVDRLYQAGLLDLAKAAIDAADLYTQERWNSRTDIYADDPTALAMLAAIGGDPEIIFAPLP